MLKHERPPHRKIQELINAGLVRLVQDGTVEARLTVLHNPYIAQTIEPGLPVIRTERAVMVAHQPVTDGNGIP